MAAKQQTVALVNEHLRRRGGDWYAPDYAATALCGRSR